MEIVNPPGWCQDAIPTTEGWTHPNTGKLLKTYGMSQEQVDEYMSRIGKAVEPVDVKVEWKNEHTHDDGTTHSHEGGDEPHDHEYDDKKSLHEMTKIELESLGRQHGIELDRRHSKTKLVEELTDHMEMKDFSDCSKMELEAIGRRYGIELDRRKKKETLIEELEEVLDDEVKIT